MNKLVLLMILSGLSFVGMAQTDSSMVRERKNIIRWNVTPMAVVGPKSFVLGYERVLKNNQTISLNVGYLEMAPRVNSEGETVQLFGDVKRGGFDVSLDYRFYFKGRNKYPAPDGLYWGPYTSIYNLTFEGASNVFDDQGNQINTVGMDMGLTMYSLGAQLGYQFIIKDRFSIDLMLMGPSFTRYAFKMNFDAAVALDPDDPFYIGLEKLLSTLVPGSEIILDGAEFSATSNTKFSYVGFRYGLQLGYVF
jgi:hypothetical protein